MAIFLDLWNELTAQVRGLDPILAQKFVNRAFSDLSDRYEWSWLRAQGVLSAPDAIDSGAVSIAQFSYDLTFDATATAILDALGMAIPLSLRSIQIGGGPPYQIATYTPGGTATLDPNGPSYQESTAVAASFRIVRAYFTPPAADFGRFISIRDPIDDYYLGFGANLTQDVLDRLDPGRSNTTQPRGLFTAYTQRTMDGSDTTGYTQRWEMWPYPTASRGYQCTYKRRAPEFAGPDDTLPSTVDADVVLWRAKYLAYEWAETNKANQPLLQGPNWLTLMVYAAKAWDEAVRNAIKTDKDIFPNIVVRGRRRGFLFDPLWLQSHDSPLEYVEAFGGIY